MNESFVDKIRYRMSRLQKQKLDSLEVFEGVASDIETQANRLSQCISCSKCRNEQCIISQCFVKVIVKIPNFTCPLNKW